MRSSAWFINALASLVVVLIGILIGLFDKAFGRMFTPEIAFITFFLIWILYNQSDCGDDD